MEAHQFGRTWSFCFYRRRSSVGCASSPPSRRRGVFAALLWQLGSPKYFRGRGREGTKRVSKTTCVGSRDVCKEESENKDGDLWRRHVKLRTGKSYPMLVVPMSHDFTTPHRATEPEIPEILRSHQPHAHLSHMPILFRHLVDYARMYLDFSFHHDAFFLSGTAVLPVSTVNLAALVANTWHVLYVHRTWVRYFQFTFRGVQGLNSCYLRA